MSNSDLKLNINERFQGLFESGLIQELEKLGKSEFFQEDSVVIDIGEVVEYLPLVLSGSLKVLTEDKEGRELLLYYLEAGDTCAVTINCCSSKSRSKIRAITESPSSILFVPMEYVEEWMAKYKSWRNFILETYEYRMNELLSAVDSLAFQNMQERLYKYLRDKAMVSGDKTIRNTQLEIANDLHSSRVVISRLLKKLEEDGLISYKRNHIVLNRL